MEAKEGFRNVDTSVANLVLRRLHRVVTASASDLQHFTAISQPAGQAEWDYVFCGRRARDPGARIMTWFIQYFVVFPHPAPHSSDCETSK